MLEELKQWIINIAKDFVNSAGTICDETKKANADFVKAFMEGI